MYKNLIVLPIFLLAACVDGETAPEELDCSSLDACGCYEAELDGECRMETEVCWCANECDADIECICGGGEFLACHDR